MKYIIIDVCVVIEMVIIIFLDQIDEQYGDIIWLVNVDILVSYVYVFVEQDGVVKEVLYVDDYFIFS